MRTDSSLNSPLNVILCAGCGDTLPSEFITSEAWEPDADPLYAFSCPTCGYEWVGSTHPPRTLRQLLDEDADDDDEVDVDLGAFARAVVRQVDASRSVVPDGQGLRLLLGNLLARIHGDGGHYVETHGWEQACTDAEALVVGLRARTGDDGCP